MITTDKEPSEGQFIRVWNFNGNIWSDVCRIKDGDIFLYDRDNNAWYAGDKGLTDEINVTYILEV